LKVRIGSRGSRLALWQAEHVRERLSRLGHEATITVIVTTGDRILERRLEMVGGKAAFLKEIEEALLANEVDLAVHSLKDVPTLLPEGLELCGILERADPRDALLSLSGEGLLELPEGGRVGTTSLRRKAQIRALRPELTVVDLRGNVETRIRKLGDYAALVLAVAGLRRLGLDAGITQILEPETMMPAPGQGAIALECRQGDVGISSATAPLHHEATGRAVSAERAFLLTLQGGCNVPLGAYATVVGKDIHLRGLVARPDGSALLRGERSGTDPTTIGRSLAEDLLARGARALMTS
jgi:hydroxymethylbilane synthase